MIASATIIATKYPERVKEVLSVYEIFNIVYTNSITAPGTIVDEATYQRECVHTCEVVDGVYYGKGGNVVSKLTYEQDCVPHTCEKVGEIYFGKDGNRTDEADYKKRTYRRGNYNSAFLLPRKLYCLSASV